MSEEENKPKRKAPGNKRKKGEKRTKPYRESERRKVLTEAEKVKAKYESVKIVGRPMGYSKRPYSDTDFKQFEDLCKIQCTPEEMCSVFDCSKQTLYDHVREYYGEDFPTVYSVKKGQGAVSLRRMQFRKAMDGDRTMLIWLGKQILGQSDVVMKDHDNQRFITFQSRIGPGGNIIQEIKTHDDWEKSKTFEVRGLLDPKKNEKVATSEADIIPGEVVEPLKEDEKDGAGR